MKFSNFFTLDKRDFIKGLWVAIFSAVITFLYQAVLTPDPVFSVATLKAMGLAIAGAVLAYLTKNLTTNNAGQVLKKDV